MKASVIFQQVGVQLTITFALCPFFGKLLLVISSCEHSLVTPEFEATFSV